MLLDRRRCIMTLIVLTISTTLVIYRFGTLSKIDLFKGRTKIEDWASSTSESNGVDPNSCQEIFSSRCTKCTSDESGVILQCSETGFVRKHVCQFKNTTEVESFQSCSLTFDETKELLLFQGAALIVGLLSILYVVHRKKQLQQDLQTKVNKMIAST